LCWLSFFKKKFNFWIDDKPLQKANISSEQFPKKILDVSLVIKLKAINCTKETGIFNP